MANLPLKEPKLKGKKVVPVCNLVLGTKEKEYVKNCMETGWISSLGSYVASFQKLFAQKMGCKYGIACSSGTTALHLALETIGIIKGDEVIVPSFTMIATANAVSICGAKPVFVDCEPVTFTMDPTEVEKKITKKTKAIIMVHIYGHPCQIGELKALAQKYKLWLVEDAAEAHGAEYKGSKIGSLGDIAAFSFYANKIITTGEGGMVTTNNHKLAESAKYLRDFCFTEERHFWHKRLGYNYRMTNLQAAIGLAQTERLERIVDDKRRIAFIYNIELGGLAGVRLPMQLSHCKNVYWMYGVIFDNGFPKKKDEVRKILADHGVETRNFFIPMHLQPIYKTKGKFPHSEYAMEHGIYLPSGLDISYRDIFNICDIIKKIYKGEL